MNKLNISFGIIVLNGEPFTKYCLRSIYPYAHEIIIVEGATKNAKSISTKNGHSKDNTLASLKEFKEEDLDNKLKIITKDGFWEEKDEMSQAYAKEATGNYLWQVDVDEFYHEDDMTKIISLLKNKKPDAVTFKQIAFHSSYDIRCNSTNQIAGADNFNRLFKWDKNYKYSSHRPPTVLNDKDVDTKKLKHIKPQDKELEDIYLYHYSLLFPSQVSEKINYYKELNLPNTPNLIKWYKENYKEIKNPFKVHNVQVGPSWFEKWDKKTPKEIKNLFRDLKDKKVIHETRPTQDIYKLLGSNTYTKAIEAIKEAFKTKDETVNLKKIIKSRIKEKIKRHERKLKNLTNRKS